MKKILSAIIALSFFTFSYAQPVQFGVKGGFNLATVRYINTDNSKARLGWNAGFLSEIPVQDNLFVRPELLYSSKGFSYSAVGTSREGSLRLNYVAVPVLFGYRPGAKSEIMAGPEFGFLRKAVSKSQDITDDRTNYYRHFDIGFDLGFAYNISKTLGVEARYNYGFKDLVNVANVDENGNVVSQGKNGANSVLQVGIYYWLSQ